MREANIRNSRFLPLYYLGLIYLAVAAAMRIFLYWQTEDALLLPMTLIEVFAYGCLYDIAFLIYAFLPIAVLLTLLPRWLYTKKTVRWTLHIAYFGAIFAMAFITIAEHLFWQEFSVRFNFIAVDYLVYRREVTDNIVQSYPVLAILVGVFLVSGTVYHFLYPRFEQSFHARGSYIGRIGLLACFFIGAIVDYEFIGQQQRSAITDVYARELASDGPYQFVAAFRNNELAYAELYPLINYDSALASLKVLLSGEGVRFISQGSRDIERYVEAVGPANNYNVMLITVESLSAQFLSYFGREDSLTPNLDTLIDQSVFFTRMFATGTRTTRGLEAISLSIPPTPGRSIIKRIDREGNLWSIGNVLQANGYDVKFIYGGRGYFDNMNTFFSSNGYGVIDQSSVADSSLEFTNAWGMSDEDLYKQAISQADADYRTKRPFFLHVMTTSNHRPYTYPQGRVSIPSGTNRAGAVMYTDYAIGRFLKEASTRDWFDQTLFVILADHTAGSAGKVDLPLEKYHIPMWIYAPAIVSSAKMNGIVSQIDVAPTILGLLNVSYRSSAFGVDLSIRRPDRALIANYQYLGYYDGDSVTILKPKREIERFRYHDGIAIRLKNIAMDESLRRASAYYQVAAFCYQNKLLSSDREYSVFSEHLASN